MLTVKLCKGTQKSQLRKIWRYNLADFDQAAELLDSIEWEQLLSDSDVDSYWSLWKQLFLH